jgi:fibronectin-binding autotransporter adhesin
VLNAVTLAPLAVVSTSAGNPLTLFGAIVNHGTLSANGDPYYSVPGTLLIGGTVALSGGGTLATAEASINANGTAALLDNINNSILGYGSIGAGNNLLKLRNEAAGAIEAAGGALVVNTGTNVITNLGTAGAIGGTLAVQGTIDGTGGGTLTALDLATDGGAVPGIILLDGGTMRGGTLRTDLTDPSARLEESANGGTLDGTAGAVTLAAGAVAAAVAGGALTIKGTIVNHGTLAVDGNSYQNVTADLLVSGSVSMSGGGSLVLADIDGFNGFTDQVITGVAGGGTLDNVDNRIAGAGQLGMANLKLVNEAKGVIEAAGGTLVVDPGTLGVTNKGLMEAVGGTLILRGVVDQTAGGTIAALNNGTVSGVVLLDGATLEGGTIVTDLHDPASIVGLTANGGTLDGLVAAITLAAGAHVAVGALEVLSVEGTLTNHGTLGVLGNGYYGQVAEARISGTVTLNGGGVVALADVSTVSINTNSQIITGAVASATLRNVDNTIVGYGSLGAGSMTLVNAAAGTIEAIAATLQIDTGANSVTNQGLLEATGGILELDSSVANSGTILAGVGGDVVVDGTVTSTSLVSARTGTVTVHGMIAGTSSAVQVTTVGTLVLDGGALNGGTLSNAASGLLDITTNGATLTTITVSNTGSAEIVGNGYYGQNATLAVSGKVTLSGGGTLALLDGSTVSTSSLSQTITGMAPGNTLDNIDNTISGYGEFGAGQLTLINEAKGTIKATVAIMVLNTGSVTMVNHGLLEAVGGILTVQTVVDSTIGGTVAALSSGTIAGVVLLDGGTLRGGSIATDPASALLLTTNGGTLDGTAGTVTLAAHSQATVAAAQTLTLEGAVSAYGTLAVLGNGYYGQIAAVDIDGSVTLFSGSELVLADVSTVTTASTSQVITGTAPGASLTNTALITGYGMLGDGALTLMNSATGTIEATGGTLVVDSGASAATNLGQILADNGTLRLESTLTNSRTITAGADGAIAVDGTVGNNGLIAIGATATMTVHGTIISAISVVQIGDGGTLVLDGGDLTDGTLTNAATGIVDVTLNSATLNSIAVTNAGSLAVMGNGYYGENATLTVGGTVTLTGGGDVVLVDNSTVTTASTSQVITGSAAGDTLDNVDNTIVGYGELGADSSR